MNNSPLLVAGFALLLAACSGPEAEINAPAENIYAAAVSNPQRSAEDRERDADRKPAAVLEFFGIKPGMRVCLMYEPPYYFELIGSLPEGAVQQELEGTLDFIHYFTMDGGLLGADFPKLKKHLDKKGMLWISWPKGKSKVPTNLNGNIVRQMGLDAGLVDTKVCSVDEVWSGLKFMWRKADR